MSLLGYDSWSYAEPFLQGGARAIQMAVQAHVIKYLLFSQPLSSECSGIERWGESPVLSSVAWSKLYSEKWLIITGIRCVCSRLSEVGEKEQERALAAALADILWTAGEERTATVSLVTPDRCFTPHLDYKLDNFTERVQFTMQRPVSLTLSTYGLWVTHFTQATESL